MDDLIKFIKEKYIEDLISPIELHKLIIFLLFVGVLGLVINTGYLGSIWLEICSIDTKIIFDSKSKLWESVTVFQVLVSLIMTLIISPIYSRLKSDFFQAFSKIKNLELYIETLTNRICVRFTGNQALDLLLVKDFSKDLSARKKKLIKLHSWGEFYISCLIISVIGLSKNFNRIDLCAGIMFLIFILIIQWKAYLYYIEKFLPIALPEKILRDGKFEPDGEY